MSKALKRIYNLGIGKETVRGTKVAPQFWLQALEYDVQDREETVKTERSYGRQEANKDQAVAKKWSQGKIDLEVFDRSSGIFLLGAFGDITTVGAGETGTYKHTFEVLQSAENPTFTVVDKRADVEQVAYANSVVESLSFDFQLNDYCKMTANMRGKGKVADTSSPTYEDEAYFMAKDVKVKVSDTYDTIGSATDLCVQSLTLEMNNNVTDDECLGNGGPVDFLKGKVEVNGEITLYFDSVYERDYAINNTSKALRIVLEDTNTTIGTTLHPKLVIDLPFVKFSEKELSSANDEFVSLTTKFTGYFSIDDNFVISAELTNTEASY